MAVERYCRNRSSASCNIRVAASTTDNTIHVYCIVLVGDDQPDHLDLAELAKYDDGIRANRRAGATDRRAGGPCYERSYESEYDRVGAHVLRIDP